MLDNELKLEIEASLPIEIPHIFFSSVTGENIMQMKDILWDSLNS
jgi:GTP-binding protein